MEKPKGILVIDNIPSHLIERMIAAAAARGLPVTLWLKLLIDSELRKEAERCRK